MPAPASADRDDGAQSRLPGPVSGRLLGALGLPPDAFAIDGVEFYGDIGFLKAGLQFADRITTVSPTYAAEIRTPEGGMGLDGLLRSRADVLSGILNGIDTNVWNPAHDPHLAARSTSIGSPSGREQGGAAGAARPAARSGALLFGVVSRLTSQKGIDLLLAALPALLGGGGAACRARLRRCARWKRACAPPPRPSRPVGVQIGYDEALAHLIQGGCDALLVPSRFEPCGLTQLCAMRYGALPVVAHVGGLCDTVIDANEMALAAGVGTGFHFAPVARDAGGGNHSGALGMAATEVWRRLQRNAMQTDVGWRGPAARYAALYRGLVQAQGSH